MEAVRAFNNEVSHKTLHLGRKRLADPDRFLHN